MSLFPYVDVVFRRWAPDCIKCWSDIGVVAIIFYGFTGLRQLLVFHLAASALRSTDRALLTVPWYSLE